MTLNFIDGNEAIARGAVLAGWVSNYPCNNNLSAVAVGIQEKGAESQWGMAE